MQKEQKLRKILNGEAEEAKPITEERLCETLNLAVEILATVFKGNFKKWKNQQYVDIVEIQLFIHQMQKYMAENMAKENVIYA